MFTHCCRKFNAYDIWFLCDNKNFINRKLNIGLCPVCHTPIVELIEERKEDGVIFFDVKNGEQALKLKDRLRTEKNYSSLDIVSKKGAPYGFIYGENKKRFNKEKNRFETYQYSCDFYGNKALVKIV